MTELFSKTRKTEPRFEGRRCLTTGLGALRKVERRLCDALVFAERAPSVGAVPRNVFGNRVHEKNTADGPAAVSNNGMAC